MSGHHLMADDADMKKIRELIAKYGDIYVMYGEYPHKNHWLTNFTAANYASALKDMFSQDKKTPLLLYVHIPFCMKQCYYCTCRTFITKDYERIKIYLENLYREIKIYKNFFDENNIKPNFKEIHLGGGTPTYLKKEDFNRLVENLNTIVDFREISEFSIEIDPRNTNAEKMKYFHSKGINRISVGVQDFSVDVQQAINRIQPSVLTANLLAPGIRELFSNGFNFDIICGLPKQTRESFRKTIEKTIEMSPDRICLLYLIVSPSFSIHQRMMKQSDLPDTYQKTVFFNDALRELLKNGYVRIGLDHFAKPNDDIVKALRAKTVFWSGLGYTAGRYHNIIGVGTSSACKVGECYSHNVYPLDDYAAAVGNGRFPVCRGYKLSDDDIMRREIIHTFRTYFTLNLGAVEKKYAVDFHKYFKAEILLLEKFRADGILEFDGDNINITDNGKYFTGLVCRVFDRYAAR